MLNFVLLHNYFTYPFHEVQIRYRKDFKFGPGRIFRKIKKIPAKAWLVLVNGAVNKNIKSKRKFLKTVSGNSFLLLTCLEPLQTYFYWTTLVTMRLFTQFQFKTRETKLRKNAKFLSYCITILPIFSLRSKFGIEKLLSLVQGVFLER